MTSENEPEKLPSWYRPKGLKSKFDFPKAKPGKPDRFEISIGERRPGKPRRLDKFLQERFPGYSRSFLQKLIKDERVLLNGKPTKSSWHVSLGEQITLLLPPGHDHQPEDIPFDVIYEDEHMLALVKPAGVIVHPARGNLDGTLYNGLLHYFKERREADPSSHIGIVHRLDEHTSGVMVVALNQKANKDLTRQFENRLLRKTYLCLVHGLAAFDQREVDAPLGSDRTNKVAMAVNGLDAKSAQTRFECLARSPLGPFSLLRAFPKTGRSHQIRVHAREIGHSLIGDELYGGARHHACFGELEPRVCLHAESLSLDHPIHGDPMKLSTPLPPDMVAMTLLLGMEPPEV